MELGDYYVELAVSRADGNSLAACAGGLSGNVGSEVKSQRGCT